MYIYQIHTHTHTQKQKGRERQKHIPSDCLKVFYYTLKVFIFVAEFFVTIAFKHNANQPHNVCQPTRFVFSRDTIAVSTFPTAPKDVYVCEAVCIQVEASH